MAASRFAGAFRALSTRASAHVRGVGVPQHQRLVARHPARAWFTSTSAARADAADGGISAAYEGEEDTAAAEAAEAEAAAAAPPSWLTGVYPGIDNSVAGAGGASSGDAGPLRHPRGFVRRVLPHPLSKAPRGTHVGSEFFGKLLKNRAMQTTQFSKLLKGIGNKRAREIDRALGFPAGIRLTELDEDDISAFVRYLEARPYNTEKDLTKEVMADIKRLCMNGSYRGRRHRLGLPVRGQRTRGNARTQKNKGPVRFEEENTTAHGGRYKGPTEREIRGDYINGIPLEEWKKMESIRKANEGHEHQSNNMFDADSEWETDSDSESEWETDSDWETDDEDSDGEEDSDSD